MSGIVFHQRLCTCCLQLCEAALKDRSDGTRFRKLVCAVFSFEVSVVVIRVNILDWLLIVNVGAHIEYVREVDQIQASLVIGGGLIAVVESVAEYQSTEEVSRGHMLSVLTVSSA